MHWRLAFFSGLTFVSHLTYAQHPTDSIQDADNLNSGYLPNHQIDPQIVESGNFGINWRVNPGSGRINGVEMFMAKPLVFTPRTRFVDGKPIMGGKQLVIAVSESNWIYVLDAVSGQVLNSRQVRKPYQASDLPCADLIPTVGVTGTPVIDPGTDTIYMFAKGYNGTQTGPFNAGYHLHALDVLTLEERPGFPRLVSGPADNDPDRYFTGGLLLQRPSLKLLNGVVYGGFGGGCGEFNQTGWIVGIDAKTAGQKALWVADSGPQAPAVNLGFYSGGGGGSVWQAGVGFPSDRDDRFFVVTGNGNAFNSPQEPASGRHGHGLLEGSIINMKIDPSGKIFPQDYFRPYDYTSLGTSFRDLGSGGLTLLDPGTFFAKDAKRLAIAGGQNGLLYLVNADNLGGYQQGPNGTDAVFQTIPVPGSTRGRIYGGAGSYPLEGGYIYVKPVGTRNILVYKFQQTSIGTPFFTLIAQTNEKNPTSVGTGVPTVTSFNGQTETGIVWILDIDLGLTAFRAVPENGELVKLDIPVLPGRAKFQRPVFGNGKLFVVTTDGHILCYGNSKEKPASIVPSVGSFASQGCYTEATANRALTGKAVYSDTLTVADCAASCSGFAYFGVEYGRECYCGDALAAGSVLGLPSGCDIPCKGDSTTLCGGRSHLNLYQKV